MSNMLDMKGYFPKLTRPAYHLRPLHTILHFSASGFSGCSLSSNMRTLKACLMRVLSSPTIRHKRHVQRRGVNDIGNTWEPVKRSLLMSSMHSCRRGKSGRRSDRKRWGEEDDSFLLHCLRRVPSHATGRLLLLKQYHTSVNGALAKSHLSSTFTHKKGGRCSKIPRWRNWARPEWLTHMTTQLNPLPKH